jgi:hypothetical protein
LTGTVYNEVITGTTMVISVTTVTSVTIGRSYPRSPLSAPAQLLDVNKRDLDSVMFHTVGYLKIKINPNCHAVTPQQQVHVLVVMDTISALSVCDPMFDEGIELRSVLSRRSTVPRVLILLSTNTMVGYTTGCPGNCASTTLPVKRW